MTPKQRALKFRPFRLAETQNVLANLLNTPIQKCFNERRMYMQPEGSGRERCYETANMLEQDAKDLREIRNYVIAGRMDLAAKKTYTLDTAVYELIPSRLYNILQEYF